MASLPATPAKGETSALELENVRYEKKGAIAYVTIDRAQVLNALNKATCSVRSNTPGTMTPSAA